MCAVSEDVSKLISVFGVNPGDDRVLVDWQPMCAWLDGLVDCSPNLSMESLGESTEGNELRMIVASSPASIARMETIRQDRTNLKYTANFRESGNADGTLAGTKPVVLITAGIHATEVGGVQMMPAFLRDLAFDPAYNDILDKLIILVIPTLNPDGMDLVHSWYRNTLGTSSEGSAPPALYHRYAGHDNNRDWYQLRLQETQAVVDKVHRAWFPHVVIDLHQMGQKSPRYVVPPYIDPAEPHVHPLVYQLASQLGTRIASNHARAGTRGVCSGVLFDSFSPTRAYMHYHGGVRILAEAASAAIASAVHISADDLKLWDDTSPHFPSVHMPLPWPGGSWHLADIIQRHRHTIDTVLDAVASESERWIADQWKMLADQVNSTGSGMHVIPPLRQQVDPAAARELIDLLRSGDVDIHVADETDGPVQAGSFVIPTGQPFGSYAAALLARTTYPPGHAAYDVTSHCLPIHMGVDVEFHDHAYTVTLREPSENDLTPFQPAQAADIRAGSWLAIDGRSSSAIRLVNHARATGSSVSRLERPHFAEGRIIPAGSWIISDSSVWDVMAHAATMHVRTWVIPAIVNKPAEVRQRRIGVYNPQHVGMSDYGWLTLWLERAGFAYIPITGEEIIHGAMRDIDVMVFPHGNADALVGGHPFPLYPVEYCRGLNDRVVSTIRTWMHRGGHIIAFEGSVTALCRQLRIQLRQPLERLPAAAFASSGAVVQVIPSAGDEAMLGIDEPFPAMYFSPNGYEIVDSAHQHSLARFAREQVCISGAVHGEAHLAGLHAIVQMTPGEGCFTAFAFRPYFRTQMLASEHVLSNVISQQFGTGARR